MLKKHLWIVVGRRIMSPTKEKEKMDKRMTEIGIKLMTDLWRQTNKLHLSQGTKILLYLKLI